jgi:alkanesulfonate monooxygenase SsuD/methylene tetrahydromethanopterin reductase-like flavin-dependent oxidoreductase (luciferase family)
MSQNKMRIGMSLRGHGYHLAAWRHPDVPADASVCIDHYVRTAQTAERGKCDLIFFADGLGIRERDVPRGALACQGRDIVDLDPLTLLPALAMVTHHIGLVATASTTYNEPYHVARKFASLDLISQGRAGWNVVTSWSEAEALNFNRATQIDYATVLSACSLLYGLLRSGRVIPPTDRLTYLTSTSPENARHIPPGWAQASVSRPLLAHPMPAPVPRG